MNRQTLLMVIFSLVLLLGVFLFSFLLLVPKGKEYRSLRMESKKEIQALELAQRRHDQVYERHQELQLRHKKMIRAFNTPFNSERFTERYKKEFEDLYLTEITEQDGNGTFKVYEVNATSKITSPQSFYHFLENVNKSEWIIGVNFPIHFERTDDKIRSSFTMKVHNSAQPGDKKTAH